MQLQYSTTYFRVIKLLCSWTQRHTTEASQILPRMQPIIDDDDSDYHNMRQGQNR
jgi:hypothetical protein